VRRFKTDPAAYAMGPPMTARTSVHGLQVATSLHRFIEDKVLPGTGVDSAFWKGFDAIVADLAPKNAALLAERDRLQTELDAWHKAHPGPITDMAAYRKFLEKIGYLVPQPAKVQGHHRQCGRRAGHCRPARSWWCPS
jgi:malate synthase